MSVLLLLKGPDCIIERTVHHINVCHKLNGYITRLFLERNGDTVQTAIKVAELVITVRMERNRVEQLQLYPGKEVTIAYDPRDIEWF